MFHVKQSKNDNEKAMIKLKGNTKLVTPEEAKPNCSRCGKQKEMFPMQMQDYQGHKPLGEPYYVKAYTQCPCDEYVPRGTYKP